MLTSRLDGEQARRARMIGLSLAFVFRVVMLVGLTWLMGLTAPVVTLFGMGISWRDIILIGGGLFLIAKATHEIHDEVEARESDATETLRHQGVRAGRGAGGRRSTWCSRSIRSSPRSAWWTRSRS